jgi:5-formyltetrahydrofolate cyclo-ligase
MADPPVDIAEWRKEQRTRLLDARKAVSLEDYQTASATIMSAVLACLPISTETLIGCYWPFRREPDCLPFMRDVLKAGGRVALPVVVARGLPLEFRPWTETTRMEAGVWNIPQPAEGSPVTPTVLVIPVVGFDDAGYRLGYGAGYYDMTLASFSPRPFTVGIGFESARLSTIYPLSHDVAMDVILTEKQKRVFRQQR